MNMRPRQYSRRSTNGKMKHELVIEENLLKSKLAIFTGGSDVTGNPLITFTPLPQQNQHTWNVDKVEKVLHYYTEVVRLILKRTGLAVLANLQHGYSEEFLTVLVKSLQKVETEKCGTVGVFYVLKPKSKTKYSVLKKLLGLKRRKGEVTFMNQFRVVMLKNLPELHHQVQASQLTVEFGGQLPYDHEAWMSFHKTILGSLTQYEDLMDKLQDTRDKAMLLQDYETTGHSAQQLNNLKLELEQKYKTLLSESGIGIEIDNCKQTLHLLDHISDEEPLCNLNQTVLLRVMTHVKKIYEELNSLHSELQSIWKSVDENLQSQIDLKRREDEANELCVMITEQFWPNMMEHPRIASCLTEAEINRTHFVSSLYEPAKEILNRATHILEELQKIRISKQHDKVGLKEIVYRLSNTIHPLAGQLNELNQTYISVHMFYITLQKCMSWYDEVLNFIPNSLCSRAVNNRNRSACLPAPTGWRDSVRLFLQRHQAPREDHVIELDTFAHPAIDKSTKTKARLISNRIRVLINLLFNTHLDVTTLCNIHAWKQENKPSAVDAISCEGVSRGYRHVNTRLKRRIQKSRTFRENDKSASLPMKYKPERQRRNLSRSSSTDTELNGRERKYSERFVCLSTPQDGFDDPGITHSVDDIMDNYKRQHSLDSLSINSVEPDTDNEDSDNVVNYIQKVTSDWSISSDQKLKYVSDILSRSSAEMNRLNIYADDVLLSPAKQISELNKRLTKSLGNIISIDNDEFQPDTPNIESVSTGDILDLQSKDRSDFEAPEYIIAFPNSYFSPINEARFSFEDNDDADDTAPEISDTVDGDDVAFSSQEKENTRTSQSHSSEKVFVDIDGGSSLLESQRALEASLRRTDLLLKKIQMSSRLRERSRLRRLVSRSESLRVKAELNKRPTTLANISLERRNSNISSKRSLTSQSTDHGYVSSRDGSLLRGHNEIGINSYHRRNREIESVLENGHRENEFDDEFRNGAIQRQNSRKNRKMDAFEENGLDFILSSNSVSVV